jgi:hypothetical protein
MGLNEDEPQQMSLDMKMNRSRRVSGVTMKADANRSDESTFLKAAADNDRWAYPPSKTV